MKLVITLLTLLITLQTNALTLGNIPPNSKKLTKIDPSKGTELTFMSFNIRNLTGSKRTIKNFIALTDIIKKADVILLQEIGLGMFDKDPKLSIKEQTKLSAIKSLFKSLLGENFSVVTSTNSTGLGAGAEASILIHKYKTHGISLSGSFSKFIDLGPKRDMATFILDATFKTKKRSITLGSVHLTPEDPHRGSQLIKVANWLSTNSSNKIVMGDFNWGYKKKARTVNYLGENFVLKLEKQNKLFFPFKDISYLSKGKSGSYRTNLAIRKEAYFYDQFLMSVDFKNSMADGGVLTKDFGFLPISNHNKAFKKLVKKNEKKGMKYLEKLKGMIELSELEGIKYELVKKSVIRNAQNSATFMISDHKPVWVQVRVF